MGGRKESSQNHINGNAFQNPITAFPIDKDLLSSVIQTRRGFAITNTVAQTTFSGEKYSFTQSRFSTKEEGDWRLMIVPFWAEPMKNQEIKLINRIRKDLIHLQDLRVLCSSPSSDHTRGIHFFSQNWPKIAEMFYRYSPEEKTQARAFSEVRLMDGGRADLVTIGKDGMIFVVELGSLGENGHNHTKSKQVRGYAETLRRQYDGINIVAMVAYYKPSLNMILIKPRETVFPPTEEFPKHFTIENII